MRAGIVFFALFGVAWWLLGAATVTGPVAVVVPLLGCAVAGGLLVTAWIRPPAPGPVVFDAPVRRRFNLVNAAQWLAIAVVVLVAGAAGMGPYIPALVAVVVGAHFLPLATLFEEPAYRITGGLLLGVAVAAGIGGVSGGSPEAVRSIAGFGSAVVLWGTAAWMLGRRTARKQAPAPGEPA